MRKKGTFEAAHTGTLFLDEIGEMSLAIQAKFLRVLEGQSAARPVDAEWLDQFRADVAMERYLGLLDAATAESAITGGNADRCGESATCSRA